MSQICKICNKNIRANHLSFQCKHCLHSFHNKCSLDKIDFTSSINSSINSWLCITCHMSIFPFCSISDNELRLQSSIDSILHLNELPIDLSLFPTSLESNIFNQLNNFFSYQLNNNDDDDINVVDNPINCKYIDIKNFNTSKITNNCFSLLHLNIASLVKHFDELNSLLHLISYEFSVIGITESKLKYDLLPTVPINLSGYVYEHTPTETSFGGALIYISEKLIYKPRNDLLMYKPQFLESVFVEIIFPKKSNIIVGCIYRHPNMDIDEFNFSYLAVLFEKLSLEKNKTIFLMGDFNIDLIKANSDSSIAEYLNTIASNNFLPFISLPTRITNHSRTLIDNIFSNSISKDIFSGNLTIRISDHLPQFLIYPSFKSKKNYFRKSNIFLRNFKKLDSNQFKNDFLQINWDKEINFFNANTNKLYEDFFRRFNSLLDKHAPLKKLSNRGLTRSLKPWITPAILTSIKKRNMIFKKFLKTKNLITKLNLEKTYKTYRNLLVTLIRRSKKNHFSNYFSSNSNNLRATWKGIRKLLNIRSEDISYPSCISSNNTIIHDPNKISEKFNSFFISIPDELQKNIHSSHTNFYNYLKTPNLESIFIKPTDENEILSIILSLNDGKASGPNSIPTFILKFLAWDISPLLSKLFNLSFVTGIFPNIFKTASVKPIHKKGSKLDCNNYRPISLLSNISKILEKLMYSRIYQFLDNSKCLYGRQFGFRLKHSTSHALISITEMIRGAIDSGSFACGVFIDLQKAFDTVDHKILIKKLYYYGIRGIANNWFSSYIENRSQFVSINGFESSKKFIKYGVPQGSVLGPLLFLIYINDLSQSIRNSTVHHFADDTNLLCINKSLTQLCKKVNSDLHHLCLWLNSNRISLNINKTEFIIFHPPKKIISNDKVKIKINGKRIFPSEFIKYLGVFLDKNLSWNYQMIQLNKKLSRANSMLSLIRHYVPKHTLISIYYSMFFSHLSYCCVVWGQQGSFLLNRINSLQRASIRIMTFSPIQSNIQKKFSELKILKFQNLIKLYNCLFVFDFLQNNLPASYNSFFIKASDTHKYYTRITVNGNLHPSFFNTVKYGKLSIKHQCISHWNQLIPFIKKKTLTKYPFVTNFLLLNRNLIKKILCEQISKEY